MNTPIVSVILPVYNGENYLRIAIDSVLNQTYQNFELIVVDDGSTDSTASIANSYQSRIVYVKQDNGGVGAAFNHGIRVARGKYISWLSHDDVYAPDKLEKQVATLSTVDGPAACYSDYQMIDSFGKVLSERELSEYPSGQILRHILTLQSIGMAAYSLVFTKSCLETIGFYDESLRYTQDADMLMRLAWRFPILHASGKLIQIREHQQRDSRVYSLKWKREAMRFYKSWLHRLTVRDLFPELSQSATATDLAKAYLWMAESFSDCNFPIAWLAAPQYLEALQAKPFAILHVIKGLVRLQLRYLHKAT